MADTIPGRRVSHGDSFYTDWFPRGGDSMLLRAESIIDSSGTVEIEVQTRGEPGPDTADTPSEVFTLTPTYVSNGTGTKLQLNDPGVFTALFRATDDGVTTGNSDSLQEQVRLKIGFAGSAGNYHVIRVFPPVFFDNAKP